MYRFFCFLLVISSCGPSGNNLVLTDLLPHGEAIKVMAPKDAKIIVENYGLLKDIIITDSMDYSLQIFISKTNTLNMEKALEDQKNIVNGARFFSKYIEENDQGFIYEKKVDDDIRYDFRYIRIQADKQYIFQPSLSGGHSEEHVRKMYESLKL